MNETINAWRKVRIMVYGAIARNFDARANALILQNRLDAWDDEMRTPGWLGDAHQSDAKRREHAELRRIYGAAP